MCKIPIRQTRSKNGTIEVRTSLFTTADKTQYHFRVVTLAKPHTKISPYSTATIVSVVCVKKKFTNPFFGCHHHLLSFSAE